MDSELWPPDKLISCLSYRPHHILKGMITISEPAQCSAIRQHSNSLIGILDCLPLEILQWALNLLDFQSLSCVSHASLLVKRVVESLPSYCDLMEHAPQTLKALGLTGLVHVHSAAALHDTLQSEACVSCGKYGAFLSLLTCEWCCYECLRQNHALWAISVNQAKKCFGLSFNHLKQVSILHSIPGFYSIRQVSRRRSQRLVSVKEAKKLAIMKHGSMENLDILVVSPIRDANDKALQEFYLFQWLRKAPLQPLNLDLSKLPTEQNTPADDHHGMASIPFPSLVNCIPENGLWCSGCQWMFECHRFGKLPSNVASELVPAGVNPFLVLRGRQDRALSRASFLHHVQHCYDARELVAKMVMSTINGNGWHACTYLWRRIDEIAIFQPWSEMEVIVDGIPSYWLLWLADLLQTKHKGAT